MSEERSSERRSRIPLDAGQWEQALVKVIVFAMMQPEISTEYQAGLKLARDSWLGIEAEVLKELEARKQAAS